jgi:hypothetical protein
MTSPSSVSTGAGHNDERTDQIRLVPPGERPSSQWLKPTQNNSDVDGPSKRITGVRSLVHSRYEVLDLRLGEQQRERYSVRARCVSDRLRHGGARRDRCPQRDVPRVALEVRPHPVGHVAVADADFRVGVAH